MTDEQPTVVEVEGGQPPLVERRVINAKVAISPQSDDGSRELSFVTAPFTIETYVIPRDLQRIIAEQFSGGIEIAQPGQIPPLS